MRHEFPASFTAGPGVALMLIGSGLPGAGQGQDGAPQITRGLVDWKLRERGALLAEDFGQADIDLAQWRVWQMNPEAAQFSIEDGRFVIEGRGPLAHNGLWSLNAQRFKDVTLVARMDIQSAAAESHEVLLHLCGGDSPRSPDHWVEVSMRDLGGGNARFSVLAAVPKGHFREGGRHLDLPRPGDGGFLARVSLDGSRNLCTPEVQDAQGNWHSLVDPVPLHLRTTHCEVKMRGRRPGPDAHSTGWFDDVRIYPRAAAHPVMVRLRTREGQSVFSRGASGHEWPPKIQIRDEPARALEDLAVELWTVDGETRICAVQSNNLGDYMLPLDEAPWEVYPVAAMVRLRIDDQQLGEVTIPTAELEGLYPNDVYDLILE